MENNNMEQRKSIEEIEKEAQSKRDKEWAGFKKKFKVVFWIIAIVVVFSAC